MAASIPSTSVVPNILPRPVSIGGDPSPAAGGSGTSSTARAPSTTRDTFPRRTCWMASSSRRMATAISCGAI